MQMGNKYQYSKKDISWLSFSYRVLLEADNDRLLLYEYISFISIYSFNLEELCKIRVADHRAVASGVAEGSEESQQSAKVLLEEINREMNRRLEDHIHIYGGKTIPALRRNHVISYQSRNVEPFHQQFVKSSFHEEIFPYLRPVPVSKNKVASSLHDSWPYLAVHLFLEGTKEEDANHL